MTFVNRQYLVETDWLAEHLDDPDLRIVDCTQYLPGYTDDVAITTVSGRENYAKGPHPWGGLRRRCAGRDHQGARRASRSRPSTAG